VSFDGLGALTTVGDDWLRGCHALASVSFDGLGALATVGPSDLLSSSREHLDQPSQQSLKAMESRVPTLVENLWECKNPGIVPPSSH
jgi:hypothetical protein